MDDDYLLGAVPRSLRLRLRAITTAGVLLVLLGFALVALLGSDAIVGASAWTVLRVTTGALLAVVVVGLQSLTPTDRDVLRASRRRTLPPLRASDRPAPVAVALRPGPVNRLRLGDAAHGLLVLTADAHGLHVPGWLLEQRPAGVRWCDVVLVRWDGVRRWRVRTDSEGPDLWVIDCAPEPGSPARWRVRRREVTDEIAVLDAARALGGLALELETSVRREPPRRG